MPHRVVLLTDLHLKCNGPFGYMDAQLDTLTRLVNKKHCDAVVINGDIFHRRNPHGKELLAFQSLLDGLKCKNIYVNTGNHDRVVKWECLDTTLSLFSSDRVKVIVDAEVVEVCGIPFSFIPHYEDESVIIEKIKETNYPIFGHFGFDGSVANGAFKYNSYVKKAHFGDRLTFLGHIHQPKLYNKNIYILGTQYSTGFGEANCRKYIHELIIRGDEIEVVKVPIEFGIQHIVGTVDEIAGLNDKFKFRDFFTILKVRVDNLDSFAENKIKEEILGKYDVAYLEVVFDDILPKMGHSHSTMAGSVLNVDNAMIEKYVKDSSTIFSDEAIMDALDKIREYGK